MTAYFAASDVDKALRVISCESGGDPNAVNRSSGAAGLVPAHSSLLAGSGGGDRLAGRLDL